MEKLMAFHVLGLEETKEEKAIKSAYMKLLKNTNPEDDPEGFKRLREAYETAVSWAREPEEEAQREKTEIELWIDEADRIYQDIKKRCDPDIWRELLGRSLVEDLDTSFQARDAMLTYLMNHVYLPEKIWKLLDEAFQIVEDRESLEQKYPADFMKYIIYYITNKEFIDYSLFRRLEGKEMDADGYIRAYLAVKRQVDQGQIADCREKISNLKAYGIYHPYEEVELLRVLTALIDKASEASEEIKPAIKESEGGKEAARLTEALLESYGEDHYVLLVCGRARWSLGDREGAAVLWKRILEGNPSHYRAKYYMVRYYMACKEYGQAKPMIMDLLEMDSNDQSVLEYLHEANKCLIEEYKERMAQPDYEEEKRWEDTMELARCFFQNEEPQEAARLLEPLSPSPDQEYDFENLYGRILYQSERYKEALPHLERWLRLILDTPEDGSEELQVRRSREFRAHYLLSGCHHELGDEKESLDCVDKAVKTAKNRSDKLSAMQYKAYVLFADKKYELCIDACDQVIEEESGYFPAYVQRQEAAFELHKGQQVVDDYYHATGIYQGYYKPYLLAAQVFFYHDQYEDAKGVLAKARENGVEFTANMKLFEVKILRNLAEKEEDREKPFAVAKELLEEIKGETDIEDASEIEYEIALLHWDNHDFDQALAHLKTAMEQNPDRLQYRMIGGHIYLDKKDYKNALAEYAAAAADYDRTAVYHYNQGLCHEGLGMQKLAMECFRKALEYQEGYRDACEKLMDYYKERYTSQYDEKDFEMALSYINRQLKVRENCYYLVERGRVYMSAFRLSEAIQDFEKALEYVHDDWASYNNMGCCYKYLGQFEKAIRCLEKAAECMGESKSVLPYSNMADCYEALRDYRRAIECYEKDLEWFPDRKSFKKEIGLLYQYLGEYDKALEYFEMEPGESDYFDNMGTVYFLKGDRKTALRFYKKGVRQAKKEDKSDRMDDLGFFYKEMLEDKEQAEYWYKQALSAAVTDDDRHEMEWKLAALYFMKGDLKRAKEHAAKSLEHFKKAGNGTEENYLKYRSYRPARLLRFGWIYICLGETEKGLQMFADMAGGLRCRQCRHQKCFESYQYLGRYYEAVGEPEKAVENYQKALDCNEHDMVSRISLERVQRKRGKTL